MFYLVRLRKTAAALAIVALVAVLIVVANLLEWKSGVAWTALADPDKEMPVYSVETEEKKIAISFDAAWGADRTRGILDVLDQYNVRTTFFLVNFWVNDHPDMAREILARGHELGNHSSTHPHMNALSADEIKNELQRAHDSIKNVTGYEAKVFRPPFGEYNNAVIKTIRGMGYEVIQWDVDSLDWKTGQTAQGICDRVLSRVKPGSIVLFHNDGVNTVEAIKTIIRTLLNQGYSIVPVSELLVKGDYYIDRATGRMKPVK